MYEYQKAVVKHRRPDTRFEEIDVRQMAVKSLLRNYENVYLVLKHPVLTKTQTLDMQANNSLFVSVIEGVTLEQWLVSNGNTTLPTVDGIPKVTVNRVLARDAWQAGYVVDACVPSGSPYNDANDYDKTDIWLRRDDTDYIDVRNHCLATVNGLVHRLDADNDGVYIKDGGITFRHSQAAHVGLMSFKGVGKVHTATITPDMIFNPDPTKLHCDTVYLKVPFDTDNKVMGVVIGGYLHLATADLKVTGSRTLKIHMNRIPFLERYMVSRYVIDQSSMERFHEISEANVVDYDLQKFYSNECIAELLTLSQSFIVGVEVDHLLCKVHPTGRTFLPGRFYYNERPLWPLRTELGLLPAYTSVGVGDRWVLRIGNNLRQHRDINNRNFRWQNKVDEKRISGRPQTFAQGELLEWYTSKLAVVAE